MSWRWSLGLVGVGGVAILAFLAVAWQPAIAPITPPAAASFAPDLVAKGEMLATAGACIGCHTTKGGARGAGGVAVKRMFGVIPSTNITPDPETGIGRWSLAAFTRAMREGVARDGKHLFMAFPFYHFTRLTDQDIGALYAYLMILPPVKVPALRATVPFLLDTRALQAAWQGLYLKPGAYQSDPSRDARWNRGAYLAEALVACSACHTGRNLLGGEQPGHPYGGALVDGWWATRLDVTPSPAPWTEAELVAYLRNGESAPHGVALGAMQKVVRDLRALPDADIDAIATYITSVTDPAWPKRDAAIARAVASPEPRTDEERGSRPQYLAACGACHEKPDASAEAARSPIGLSSALWMEEPVNFIRIMLDGIRREDGVPGPTMPGFRDRLSDSDISTIAQYLRKTRTTLAAWGDLTKTVGRVRAATAPPTSP